MDKSPVIQFNESIYESLCDERTFSRITSLPLLVLHVIIITPPPHTHTDTAMLGEDTWCVIIVIHLHRQKHKHRKHLQRVQLFLEDQRHLGVRSGPVTEEERRQTMRHQTSICRHVLKRSANMAQWETEFTPLIGPVCNKQQSNTYWWKELRPKVCMRAHFTLLMLMESAGDSFLYLLCRDCTRIWTTALNITKYKCSPVKNMYDWNWWLFQDKMSD